MVERNNTALLKFKIKSVHISESPIKLLFINITIVTFYFKFNALWAVWLYVEFAKGGGLILSDISRYK